jgi:hypothetical protein
MAARLRSEEIGLAMLKLRDESENAIANGREYPADLDRRYELLREDQERAFEVERHFREGASDGGAGADSPEEYGDDEQAL